MLRKSTRDHRPITATISADPVRGCQESGVPVLPALWLARRPPVWTGLFSLGDFVICTSSPYFAWPDTCVHVSCSPHCSHGLIPQLSSSGCALLRREVRVIRFTQSPCTLGPLLAKTPDFHLWCRSWNVSLHLLLPSYKQENPAQSSKSKKSKCQQSLVTLHLPHFIEPVADIVMSDTQHQR